MLLKKCAVSDIPNLNGYNIARYIILKQDDYNA